MEHVKVWIDEHGIMHERHDSHVITWEALMYAAGERVCLAGENKMPLLVEFRKMFAYTTDIREADKAVILKNVSALAYLTQGGAIGISQRNTIKRYLNKMSWPVPIMIFSSRSKALEWLETWL